jgi:uncharacterized membrane protein YhaH (DUF805 family)
MERIKSESEFGMIDWWKKVFLENYANFEGRARRSEYWYYTLCSFLIVIGLYVLTFVLALLAGPVGILTTVLIVLFAIATIIPNIAVAVRRLHDTNKSGWWLLISFIPLGGLVLLVFYFTEGTTGDNDYGPDPKQVSDKDINQIGTP